MSFDLDKIKLEDEGTEMTVLHPTTSETLKDEEGKVATIRLAGMDSDIYRKAANTISNKRIKQSRGASLKINAERMELDALELICKCTLSWSNIVINGETPKTAEELYQGRKWLRDQADQWIHDRANYLGN